MKLSKWLLSIIVAVAISLLYVHQQVELVKLSYSIDCKEAALKYMLDRRARAGYNVNNLEAPSRLENALLAQKIEVAYPKRAQIVKGTPSPIRMAKAGAKSATRLRTAAVEKRSFLTGFFEFFGIGAEAFAKEK